MHRLHPWGITIALFIGCGEPNNAPSPSNSAMTSPSNSATNGTNVTFEERCTAEGGTTFEVENLTLCYLTRAEWDRYYECFDGTTPRAFDEVVRVCGPESVTEQAIREQLGLGCTTLADSRDRCDSGVDCTYIAADKRWSYVDDTCTPMSEGLCIWHPYRANNGIAGCYYSQDESEGFAWAAGSAPPLPGWQFRFDPPFPPICDCFSW